MKAFGILWSSYCFIHHPWQQWCSGANWEFNLIYNLHFIQHEYNPDHLLFHCNMLLLQWFVLHAAKWIYHDLLTEVLSKQVKKNLKLFTFCKLKCISKMLTAGLCSSQCQKGMIIEKKWWFDRWTSHAFIIYIRYCTFNNWPFYRTCHKYGNLHFVPNYTLYTSHCNNLS